MRASVPMQIITQKVVHAFYQEYGLPCDEELARAGLALFAATQPAL